jgi:CBS domain-containing protein
MTAPRRLIRVANLMIAELTKVLPPDSAYDAARGMAECGVRHLLVDGGNLEDIVSLDLDGADFGDGLLQAAQTASPGAP